MHIVLGEMAVMQQFYKNNKLDFLISYLNIEVYVSMTLSKQNEHYLAVYEVLK